MSQNEFGCSLTSSLPRKVLLILVEVAVLEHAQMLVLGEILLLSQAVDEESIITLPRLYVLGDCAVSSSNDISIKTFSQSLSFFSLRIPKSDVVEARWVGIIRAYDKFRAFILADKFDSYVRSVSISYFISMKQDVRSENLMNETTNCVALLKNGLYRAG